MTAQGRTYAQVTAPAQASVSNRTEQRSRGTQGSHKPATPDTAKTPDIRQQKAKRLNEIRREREKNEVTLSLRNVDSEARDSLTKMTEKDIIALVQSKSHCEARGVRKTARGSLIVRCSRKEDADAVRNIDADQIAKGMKITERTYGIVLDGVPKYEVDFKRDKEEDIRNDMSMQTATP